MEKQTHEMKVIISGGGTGGHVFPAIAIAHAIRKSRPDAKILFVGAEGRMEMEKVPAAGYKIIGLKISGFRRSLSLKNLAFPFRVLAAMRKAGKIIRDFSPDVVVGVGGYASGPLVKVATRKRIPAVLQEQNSYPGITNKLLAARASRICVAYDGMEKYFPKEKILLTGNPVRQDIMNLSGKRERALEVFGFSADRPVVLVVGGSLGARTINESIHQGLARLSEAGVQLLWQTGKLYGPVAREAVSAYSSKGMVATEFITQMDLAYAVADLVVSRAGAISISELCLVRKPAILIPSPNVAEDHQTRNALALVNYQAALMVRDQNAREQLTTQILDLLADQDLCARLQTNIASLGRPDAADKIASVVTGLVNQ